MKTLLRILFSCVLFLSFGLKAQNPVPIQKMVMEKWTNEEGLISNNLTSVSQSSEGYIWVTCFNGALRFDGLSFKLFDKENVPELSTNAFYSLMEDEGKLYFSSQGSGILVYEKGKFEKMNIHEVSSVRMTHMDRQDRLWIATNNEGVLVLENDSIRKIDYPALEQIIVLDIAEDTEGSIWIATGGNGIIKLKDGEFTRFTEEQGLPDDYVPSLLVDSQQKLWAGTQKGLASFEQDHFTAHEESNSLEINNIIEDKEGYLWVAAEQGLIRLHISEPYFELFDEKRGLPANQVSGVAIDHEGGVWLSTKKAGLIYLKLGSIKNLSTLDGLSNPRINIVYEDEDKFYIGCDDGSINIYDGSSMKELNLAPKENGVGIRDFARGNDGALWIASYLGIIRYQNGQERLFTTEDGLSSNSVRRVLKSSDGSLWLATRTGGVTHIIDESTMEHYTTDQALESNYVLSIEEDREGNIVVGTHSGGISIIDKEGKIETYYIPGINGTLFFNITVDEDNKYWLSTNIGIYCFQNNSFKKVEFDASFKTETFFDLIIDQSGNAWTSTNIGIVRVNFQDLESFASGELEKVPAGIYDSSDGMITKECTGATRSLLNSDGQVMVPTLGGIAIIDANNLVANEIVPNVSINSFMVDGEERDGGNLEPGHRRYSLNFASLSYVATNKNQYQYKLENFDEEWISTSDNEVEYTNLGPGKYNFRVIASNNNNIWNEEGASLAFVIEPYFYQTIWFYLTLFALAGLLIYLAFIWRLSKVKEVNAKLVKVNEELDRFVYSASHDLRAPLSSILGLVEVAQLENTVEGKDECIQMIGQSIDKLDNFIKDIIDYSRSQRLDLVYEDIDIVDEINQILAELKYLDKNDSIESKVTSNVERIMGDKRRLTVVLKNLIANAIIYHDPGKETPFIHIEVDSDSSRTLIRVKDNGQGISKSHLPNIFKMFYRAQEDSRGSGLGLYIVKEAIDKIEGRIDVDSTLGKGTTFHIKLPVQKT